MVNYLFGAKTDLDKIGINSLAIDVAWLVKRLYPAQEKYR